jgi:hypothetical protein
MEQDPGGHPVTEGSRSKGASARLLCGLCLVSLGALVIGCGGKTPSPTPSPSSSPRGDVPPTWVQSEVMWQSLAAGEPHPRVCQWLYTSAARAAFLGGRTTSYLRSFARSVDKAYVVVLQGHFRPIQGKAGTAHSLYLVLTTQYHYYLARGSSRSEVDLARLGRFHSYAPRLAISAGVWGHTMFEGGPAPGGPVRLSQVVVAVWAGATVPSTGAPLRRVRSDADGFFVLQLPPGLYTLRLEASNYGFRMPATVTVEAGRAAAAGVYGEGM